MFILMFNVHMKDFLNHSRAQDSVYPAYHQHHRAIHLDHLNQKNELASNDKKKLTKDHAISDQPWKIPE